MLLRISSLICLCTLLVTAQSPLGTVTGVVTDPSQSPVPNASVTLTNQYTGVKRSTTSNPSGVYTFPNLPPGSYGLAGSAAGFKEFETTEPLVVPAYRTIRQDLRLEVQSAAAEITVTEAASPMIQTDSPQINNRLSGKQVIELPTNLRSIYNNSGDSGLIFIMMPLTTPGMVQVGAGAAWLVPGSGANGVKVKVDGIETTFGNFGSPDSVSQPSFESLDEFTANINSNRAEFGGMGTITSVTKSGTNAFHGSVFWYIRNSALDARNPFVTAKPFQNIHNYGAALGGPIIKNKTFFFANFDGTRGSRAYLFTSNVPTLAQRAGDFTGGAALRNPFSGFTPFEANRLLPQYITPQAKAMQEQYFPLPNFGPPSLTAGNYHASFNGPEVHRIVEGRIDHNFTTQHSAFLRYQAKKDDYRIPGARSALPPQSVGTSTNIRRVNFFTFGDVASFTPTIFNEFRAGVLILVSQSDADIKGGPLLDKFGIAGLTWRAGIKGVPNMGITGLTTVTQTLLNPVNDGHAQFSDNLTWVRGRHSMKFGAEMIQWFVNRYLTTDTGLFGNLNFSSTQFTGNPYADFLLGIPTSVTRVDPWPTQYSRFRDWNLYAQDDFKITARLTLSYGLRYEYNGPAHTLDGNMYSFDLASGSVVVPSDASRRLFSPFFPRTVPIVTADQSGRPEALRSADKNNFAPRFGFSYQLDPKTVIRGGTGIYYSHYSGAVSAALATGPYSLSTTATNSFASGVPAFTLANPFTLPGVSGTLNFTAVDPDLSNSYVTQYSLSVERELTRDIGLRVSYIGSQGRQLPYQRNANQPFPSTTRFTQAARPFPLYNNVTYAANGANSSYSGLQTTVQKRFSNGLLFSSAWTWAKQISEVDDTGNAELNTLIENAYDRRRDRANLYSVPRHQWMNQILYELPFAAKGGIAGLLFGGWQTNFLINVSTGNFLNPQFSGSDPSNTNNIGGRPDVVTAVTYPKTVAAWYDRTAFAVPPANAGRFGNAGRNTIVGPGYVVANFGTAKTFRFERVQAQLGATFQNLLNHPNLGQPNMTINATTGGTITSTHIFPPAGSARTGQLSLRFMF